MSRTLLIDADIIAYQSTAANERKYDWGGGVTSKVSDFAAAKRMAEEQVDHLADTLKADAVIICLSDDLQNFREEVWPKYKQHRTGNERPEHLYDLKEWFGTEYQTATRPTLEADDVMGILSTEPHEGQRIIVSADKDMQTVPGWLFNPRKDTRVRNITPMQAERFMLFQALTGDPTDGYPGCPGIGAKGAERILSERTVRMAYRHELTAGPRKGQSVERVKDVAFDHVWTAIKQAYYEAGLTEQDAITQVNLARILKHSDMDGTRIIPWVPSMIRWGAN